MPSFPCTERRDFARSLFGSLLRLEIIAKGPDLTGPDLFGQALLLEAEAFECAQAEVFQELAGCDVERTT